MDREIESAGRQAWTLAFAIAIAIAIAVCVVKGDYVVMVRIHSFSNPGSLLANQDCCDFQSRSECQVPGCDNRFVYCLRRNANSSDENCRVNQQINLNDAPLEFSEPVVLGLPNPLPLQGLTREWNATQGVYFHLEVFELDLNSRRRIINGGLVIRVFECLQLQIGVETDMFTFSYDADPLRATITLSFRVVCASGFTGEFCQTNIDDCVEVNCGNGVCVDGIDSFTCNCNTGYNGTMCDMDINECLSNPCGTNGQCVNQEGTFQCNCDPGFTGEFCLTNIDECMGVNCSGNGNCSDSIYSFTCNCIPGYTGTLCDMDIDECSSNPCGTNGQCVDGVNTFNCSCDPGFMGEFCQTNIELQSSGVQAGPIVGGVLGALISLILILAIVVTVVLTIRCLNRQGKKDIQGRTAYSDAIPGDNPVYERGNTAVTLETQSTVPVHYVNVSSNDIADVAGSAPDRVFDNPIYGGNDEETEDVYADPDANHHAGTGMRSAPYHEFDNPIYGGELDENAYSLLADSSTANGTASSKQYLQIQIIGAHVIGNEQTYDHVN